jgi:hypothetical protein
MGQCLQWTLDRGFPGFFYPAALGPGAGWALLFAAIVYLLFLGVYGIRKAFHWQPAVREEKQSALTEGPPLAASLSGEKQSALTEGTPLAASLSGEKQSARKPLLLALGIALAWGILSVGPPRLADTLAWTIPHDDVRAPNSLGCPVFVLGPSGLAYAPTSVTLEADGMCHLRWGGDVTPLVNEVFLVGQNGLLAFLAVGAALLLWPRLRAGMLETSPSRAELRAPTLDLGTSNQPADGPGDTVGDKLRQLAALRDDGIISSEEFEAKKAELLRAF